MNRANQHVKDATRRLYLSNRSGWGVYAQRATLKLMDYTWSAMSLVSVQACNTAPRAVLTSSVHEEKGMKPFFCGERNAVDEVCSEVCIDMIEQKYRW